MDFNVEKHTRNANQAVGDGEVTEINPSPAAELLNLMGDIDELKFPPSSSTIEHEHLHHQKKPSDDFEHVDPFTDHYNNTTTRDKIDSHVQGKAAAIDDFLTDTKKQFNDSKADFGMEFSKFGANIEKAGSDFMSGFEQKIENTKDFMAAERGGGHGYYKDNIGSGVAEISPKHDDDAEFFNNSENSSPIKKPSNKLPEQIDSKVNSSEELLGGFVDQRNKQPDFNKPAAAAFNLSEFDDLMSTTTKEPTKPIEKATKIAEDRPSMPPPAIPSRIEDIKEPTPPPVLPPKIEKKKAEERPQMIQAEEMFYKFGLDAWFKPDRLHPRVESLIYWRDVKKSGIVCGAGLIILLAISCFSAISVIAYLSLLTLAGTIAFRIYKNVLGAIQKTSDGHPFKEYLELDMTLSQDKVQQICSVAVAHVNAFINELRRLFLVDDLIDSLKFGFILWVLTYIGSWFNGMTLVILAFIALFTLPKVYEQNKQIIDQNLDIVKSKFLEITDKIKVAVPIGKKPTETEKEK